MWLLSIYYFDITNHPYTNMAHFCENKTHAYTFILCIFAIVKLISCFICRNYFAILFKDQVFFYLNFLLLCRMYPVLHALELSITPTWMDRLSNTATRSLIRHAIFKHTEPPRWVDCLAALWLRWP